MQHAATLAPQDAKVQYYLAECSLSQGQVKAARTAYQQAVKLDAKVADPFFATKLDQAWADHLMRQGRPAEAIQVYEDLLRQADAGQAFFMPEERLKLHDNLARSYAKQGQAAKAAEHERQAAHYREVVAQQQRRRQQQQELGSLWGGWVIGGFAAAGLQFVILLGMLLIVCIAVGVLRSRSLGEEQRVRWTFKEVMAVYGEFFVWPIVGLLLFALLAAQGNPHVKQYAAWAWGGLGVLLAGPVLFMLTIRHRFENKFARLYPGVTSRSLDGAAATQSLLGWELLTTLVVHFIIGTISLVVVWAMMMGTMMSAFD
jgi:tetratricopeptide (TPR) repeat protein